MSCETSFVFCGPTLLNGQKLGKSTQLEEKERKSNIRVKTRKICKVPIQNVSYNLEKRSHLSETVAKTLTCHSHLGETVTATVTSNNDRRNSDLFNTVSYFAKYETVNPNSAALVVVSMYPLSLRLNLFN